jgi:hypothetical protein
MSGRIPGLQGLTSFFVFFFPSKLIMYWYGMPEQGTGRNLATCVWQTRAHALAANTGPNHLRAIRVAALSYETFQLERYTLRKTAGSRRLEVLPFDGGKCQRHG